MTKYSLNIKTVQANAFKILIEALKELLNDTCIEFDSTGIKISQVDTYRIVLVHMKLDAKEFEEFYCLAPIYIGVNMLNLHKIIKTINSNDTLSFFMYENDNNHLYIGIESCEKNTKTVYKLDLLDISNNNNRIKSSIFDSLIAIPSVDFQKICRDMHGLAEFVEIKKVKRSLINDNSTENNEDESLQNDENIIQGVFKLKYIVNFTKCTNLSNNVDIFIQNNYPLIIRYIFSLGVIKFCLAPKKID